GAAVDGRVAADALGGETVTVWRNELDLVDASGKAGETIKAAGIGCGDGKHAGAGAVQQFDRSAGDAGAGVEARFQAGAGGVEEDNVTDRSRAGRSNDRVVGLLHI